MSISLTLTPRKPALLVGFDNALDVLVRVTGPGQPPEGSAAKSLNLAVVIDQSGSMSGHPLEQAKRCAASIVDRLGPNDYISIVTYGSEASVVWSAGPVVDKLSIKQAIGGIQSCGMTALHDGWLAGAEQAAKHVKAADVSRVLLLSDGCANEGETDPKVLADHCAKMAEKGVGTSTYGLGVGFNETLMFAMAKAGGGNAYYGQTADDLMGPFQEEFDLLRALCARQLVLTLDASPGVTASVLNAAASPAGGWRLPDLAYGSESWALVRLNVPAAGIPAEGAASAELLHANVTCSAGDGSAVSVAAKLALPGLPSGSHSVLAEDETVARRSQEVEFAGLQQEASDAAEVGDWIKVEHLLEKARRAAADHDWLQASMAGLERLAQRRDRSMFAKEARFKSSKMMSRLVAFEESDAFSVSEERAAPSFLRRKLEEGRADQN